MSETKQPTVQDTVTFIHTADLQLGMRRHVFNADTQGRFTQDRIDVITTLMDTADTQDAQFVVVAGDMFDDNLVDKQTVRRALDAFHRAPTIPVFILPANHDPLDPASVYLTDTFQNHCPKHVTVLTDTTEHKVTDGVTVVGAPWRTRKHATNPLTELAGTLTDHDHIRIVVAHGGVDTAGGAYDAVTNVLFQKDLDALIHAQKAQYVALGDRHSTTQVGDTKRVWFSGAPEATSPRETDPGNVLAVTLNRDDITVTPIRVGRWQFVNHIAEVDSDTAIERFITWLNDPTRDRARTVLRVSLTGVVTLAQHARLMAALDDANDVYASLNRWERHDTLTVAPDDNDFDAMNLAGFVADAFDELRRDADTDPVAAGALALMYQLALKAEQ